MKTFKEFRGELGEGKLRDVMATEIGGIPLSSVASRSKAVERDAELQRQAMAPPKKPFKVGPDTIKTDGGLVNFPKSKSVDLDKPRETSPMATASPTKLATAPLAKPSGDAAREAPKKLPAAAKPLRRLSTADTSKPSRAVPVVDTSRKPISKGSTATAPKPVINKVAPKELIKPRVAAKTQPKTATPKPVTDVAQQVGATARMGQGGTFSNIARGASSGTSSSGMFSKAGTAPSDTKTGLTGAARDVELAKRGFKKF